MESKTPIFEALAAKYRYDTVTGWAFEDGPCKHSPHDEPWQCCPRPWSDAWDALEWALGDWDSRKVELNLPPLEVFTWTNKVQKRTEEWCAERDSNPRPAT